MYVFTRCVMPLVFSRTEVAIYGVVPLTGRSSVSPVNGDQIVGMTEQKEGILTPHT